MVLSFALLALLATVAWGAPKSGGPKKLADAFTVWGVKGSADESKTEIGPFDPKSPDSCAPFYDHDVDIDAKDGKQLNIQWKQIIDLNSAALDALSRSGYESQSYSRNHAKSFFGFNPRMVAGKELLPGGASLSRDVALHSHAVDWYSRVDGQIKRANPKSPKPILACGSRFLTLRKPSDCHLIGRGKCAKKPGTNKDLTEEEHYGADEFEHKDIFWAGAPFYVYWTPDRDDFTSEWPVDPSIGAAHYCSHEANYAWKIKFGPNTPAIVILCPSEITGKRVHDLVDTTPQKLNTALDTMEVKALTLYHELFHMFEFQGRVTDDTPIWIAKSKKGWPRLISSWKLLEPKRDAWLATHALYQNLYDQAEPKVPVLQRKQLQALNAPNTYAWFALASLLSSHNQQDWSDGTARAPGSAWQQVHISSTETPGPEIDPKEWESMAKEASERYARAKASFGKPGAPAIDDVYDDDSGSSTETEAKQRKKKGGHA